MKAKLFGSLQNSSIQCFFLMETAQFTTLQMYSSLILIGKYYPQCIMILELWKCLFAIIEGKYVISWVLDHAFSHLLGTHRLCILINLIMVQITVKGAWHENFEKLILLKLADKVSFHWNIPSTMKKKKKKKKVETCILFRSNRRKLCLCYYSLFYLVWWSHCLISKYFHWFLQKVLDYSHQISAQKSEKYDWIVGTKIRVALKKKIGDVVVDHVRYL